MHGHVLGASHPVGQLLAMQPRIPPGVAYASGPAASEGAAHATCHVVQLLPQDIFFGTGHLADLLPDIEAEHYYDEQQQQPEDEGPVSEDLDNAAAPGRRSGSIDGSNRSLTPYSSSQFPLLEETEPDQPTQLPQGQAALSRTTQVALRWACWAGRCACAGQC